MSDQKYYLITKEDAEVILNKSKRLTWDDANEVMAIIKDLKAVNFKGAEVSPFANKFSGTGDRNEKEVRDPLADAMVSGDVIWDETGNPI
jgi:hypothetical protein|tara:strand:- start:383 stop:652 length:270 start_codon:yes stop_codon:yes gene_type:complete